MHNRPPGCRVQLLLIVCVAAFISCNAWAADMFSIDTLRCEDRTNPLGIDQPHPRLSWQMKSDQRGQMQSAYRILVASSEENLRNNRGDLWDSGKSAGDRSVGIEYSGSPLASRQACYWKVIVWNQGGDESSSVPADWEMGLLSGGDWQAKWIDSPDAQSKEQPTTMPGSKTVYQPPNRPPYFRKAFVVAKPIAAARLYISALGLYDCSINGHRVGDAVLAPDWTDYHKRVQYQTYDVTPMLRGGDNAIGAILGDGWYAGHVAWLGGHAYGTRPALLAQLMIEYADGSRDVIASDSSWKTSVGPILISDLLQGEDYDARKEFAGLDASGFDDSSWKAASLRDEHPHLEAAVAPPVRRLLELPVKTTTEPVAGQHIYDFGQNMVGYVRLSVTADAGAKITLRFAEMLNLDGTIYTENLRHARATDTYICRGGGVETWEPHFTFHGFRYVEVTTDSPSKPQIELTGVVIGSDCPPAGSWECSDPSLNQLQHNIVWGQRGNYVSVPTDCPQRDERMGWMGDAQVFIRTATFNFNVRNFFENWLVDVMDAQSPDGAYSDVSPRPLKTAGDGVAAWADAGVICPWTIYQIYGDTSVLRRQYDSMAKYIDYLKAHSDHLIRPAKGYGDWLSIAADTPKDVLATAYFAYSTRLMSRIADAIGKPDDAAKYEQLFQQIRQAFNDKFVAADGRITGNTQTCYLIALKFELLDQDKQQRAVQYLVDDIEAKHDHLSTGFVGVSYLLPILTKYGHTDVAYRLLEQDTFPSWLFSVRQGATTIWERWDGWTPDKGFQTPKMNSFNHYSLGSCGEWMYDAITGIAADAIHPGYKQAIIHPRPGGGLAWAKATYESDHGPIKTDWRMDNDRLTLNVTIPPNTTATVFVPAKDVKTVRESDQPIEQAKGVKFVKQRDDAAVFDVESGSYVFTTNAK